MVQGVRQVNVPKKSMELLQKLYQLGYLKKEPIKYLPKTSKGCAQTFRSHIMKALQQGLNQAYPDKSKLTNYLPITTIRDFLYNIIMMPRIIVAAKQDGEFDRIKGMLQGYYSRKGQQTSSMKKEFSLLSQYLSNNDKLEQHLMSQIQQILQSDISICHYYALYIINQNTTFHTYATTSGLTDKQWNTQTDIDLAQAKDMLSKLKIGWSADFRKATKNILAGIENYTPKVISQSLQNYKTKALQLYDGLKDYEYEISEPISVQGHKLWASNPNIGPDKAEYYWSPPDNNEKLKAYKYNEKLTQRPWQEQVKLYKGVDTYRQALDKNKDKYQGYRKNDYNYDNIKLM